MTENEIKIIKAILNSNDPNNAVSLFASIVESIANEETKVQLFPASQGAKL